MKKWMPEEYLVTVLTYLAYFSFSSPHPGSESLISWTVRVRKCSRGFRVLESTHPTCGRVSAVLSVFVSRNMWGCSCSFRVPTPAFSQMPPLRGTGGKGIMSLLHALLGLLLCNYQSEPLGYFWFTKNKPHLSASWPSHHNVGFFFFFMPTSM